MKGVFKFSTLTAAVLAASMTLYSSNAAAAGQADIDAALAAAREAVAAAQRAEAAPEFNEICLSRNRCFIWVQYPKNRYRIVA